MMLSRAALPAIRQRSLAAPARLVYSNFQIRSYAKVKGKDYKLPESAAVADWQKTAKAQDVKFETPLRPVRPSPSERINPQPTEYQSRISSTVAAPEPSVRGTGQQRPSLDDSVHTRSPEEAFTKSPRTSPKAEPRSPTEAEQESIQDPAPEAEPTGPLPDLTKGIPSTLEAELSQASRGKAGEQDKFNITESPESPPPGPGGRGGELPRDAYVSSSDRRRSAAVKYVYLGLLLGATGYLLYLGRNWDNEEEKQQHPEAPDGYTPSAMYDRVRARFGTTVSYYSDPVTTKLLPDEDPDPNMRMPFVLVLSLEDLLVHSEWSRQTGWRIAKRPGLDYFLRYLCHYYEIVLFTSQPSYITDQILRKLDPYSMIRWPLFREHTTYQDGGYIKDLSYLNRDLKKVIAIDTDPHHVKNQPENAIVIPKWKGDPKDQTLIQMIPFLEYVATMGIEDTREVLKSFEGKSIPVEFARREKLLREKFEREQGDKRKHQRKGGFGLGSLLGAKQQPQGVLSADLAATEGKMIWDQIREQGQKNYEALEKRIQEEGSKWLAEREAEEKKAQEEFSQNMKSGMFGFLGSKKPAEGQK